MKVTHQAYKNVGIFLLLLGIIDLAILFVCLATQQYYASNFNIFAIIPGILLMRSSVKTARFLRWMAPFIAVVACGFYAIVLFSKPLDLIITQLRLNTYVTMVDFVIGLLLIGVLLGVYRQLSSEESLSILAGAGYKTGKPVTAIIAGLVIVISVATGSYFVLTSEAAEKAKSLAAERAGNEYRYYLSSIEFLGDEHGTAVVTVYNNKMITSLSVEW